MRTQIEAWKQDIWDKQDEVDPDNETHDWESLALGYFVGLGMSSEDAEESVKLADKEGLI